MRYHRRSATPYSTANPSNQICQPKMHHWQVIVLLDFLSCLYILRQRELEGLFSCFAGSDFVHQLDSQCQAVIQVTNLFANIQISSRFYKTTANVFRAFWKVKRLEVVLAQRCPCLAQKKRCNQQLFFNQLHFCKTSNDLFLQSRANVSTSNMFCNQ